MNTRFILFTVCLAILPGPLVADEQDRVHGDEHEHDVLEEVLVTATPLSRDALEMTQSASVLAEENLERARSASLGQMLENMPGVANASFGGSVGRPVIRGLDASRVGILENNVSSNDVSKVSQDHAVSIEPFMADQVEVLRGPATLLYGSDTIGGVVNVRTNRIPQSPPDGVAGRALVQVDTAGDERYGVARLDWGNHDGQFGFHVDGFHRDSSDYEIPGYAETDPEPGGEKPGALFNSFLDNQGGAVGASWFGDRWQAGVSWSGYDSRYSIPGEGHDHDQGHEEDEEEEEEGAVTIDMKSRRIDAEVEATAPFAGIEKLKLQLGESDYEHTEFEGRQTGTVFRNDTRDTRFELTFEPRGDWRAVAGFQHRDRDFDAVGEEAFVPPSATAMTGLFLLQEYQFDHWRLDAGLRAEDTDTRVAGGRRAGHNPFSMSLGALWHLDEATHVTLNLASAERAPGDQELFSGGPHVATQTFERGNSELQVERSESVEFSVRRHAGRLTGSATVYRNDFDDFIYLADTGLVEDELPVRQWSQRDAKFTGAELEVKYDLGQSPTGHWQWTAFADFVRAELRGGENLPRIPPRRFGLGLDWDHGCWAGALKWIHASGQDRTGPFESPTSSYDLVEADLSCELGRPGDTRWTVFLKARNLADEEIRHHASFLKDQAPQAGRNWVLGARVAW